MNAEIANWSEPLPADHFTPAFSDLPKGVGAQLAEGQNASGVYRCILLDAAWHTYTDCRPRADQRSPGGRVRNRRQSVPVPRNAQRVTRNAQRATRNEDTVFVETDIANQICRGVVGQLAQ